MSLLSFCVFKACRKWETWASTIGRQEKEAWKLILHKLGKGHCKMLSICHAQLAACFQRAVGKKKVVFSCKVCALSDSTSSPKAQRESDWRTAWMSFFANVQKSSSLSAAHFVCVCLFFCSTPPSPPTYSRILIRFPKRFADSIQSWGISATALCPWMRSQLKNMLLQGHP